MSTLKYCISIILTMLCFISCKSQDKQLEGSSQKLFEDYISTFEHQSLPFIINKKEVAKLRDYTDATIGLTDDFKVFLPTHLKTNTHSEFRCISLLPNYGSFKAVLILEKFTDKYESIVTKIHLVTYDQSGQVIDSEELAGYRIDTWEASTKIAEDYQIEKYMYQFRMHEDRSLIKYFRLKETSSQYEISLDGKISELNITVTDGYFEASLNGYKLVKLVD